MISLLLLLPLLAVSDPAPTSVRPASEAAVAAPVGMPGLVGKTVLQAKGLMPGDYVMKIKDPIWGWRFPTDADNSETIIKQTPPEGSPLPAPIPAGYFVGVIIDPGGQLPLIISIVTLVVVLLLLALAFWKGRVTRA